MNAGFEPLLGIERALEQLADCVRWRGDLVLCPTPILKLLEQRTLQPNMDGAD
jgi:hypothetical protein